MKNILIIEDEEKIREELKNFLENNGYEAKLITNFENTEEEILKTNTDLILLDINIPNQNGMYLCKEIRKKIKTPIIIVTSRNTEIDELLCMNYGADDFITKPYNPNILLLRIGAVLKRLNNNSDTLIFKDLTINISKGIIKKGNEEIILTKNEMIIFSYLVNHQNRIVTRDELMTSLWNNEEFINDNALTVNISRLRTKLKSIGYDNAIDTRKGMGYILS